MVSAIVNDVIGKAMAKQVKRVNNGQERLAERNRELEQEVARLRHQLEALMAQQAAAEREADHRAIAAAAIQRDASKYMEADGKLIGNQRQYCDYWKDRGIKQYQVSRWIRTGELKTVNAYGRTWVILTQEPPPAKRGRKAR